MADIKLDYRIKDVYCFRHYLTKKEEMSTEIHNVSHSHPQNEIYYFAKGKAKFTVNEKIFEIENGDILMIEGYNHHTIEVDPEYDYERYCVEISNSVLLPINGITPLQQYFNKVIHCIHLKREDLSSINVLEKMQDIENECLNSDKPLKAHAILLKIISLICEMGNIYQEKNKDIDVTKKFTKNDICINRAFEYINKNLDKTISVDELAKYSYLSRSYFQHLFKKYTGLSIKDYIMRQKMFTARYMLQNGYALTDISVALGYKYYSLFSQHYKKFFGVSPKKY